MAEKFSDPLKEAVEVEESVSSRNKAEKLTPSEEVKRELDAVSDEKIKEGFEFFKEKGIEPDGICFLWTNTHDYDNAEVCVGMVASTAQGEVRFELTEYEKPKSGEMRAEYAKYKKEIEGAKQ